MCSNADPRAALAEYIRHKTDNGNKVVDYLHDVLEDRLDGVKHGHRECAAAILTEYGDLAAIRFQEKNKEEKKAKPSPKPRKREEREDSEFDAALARVIRDKTNDAQDVADYLISAMNGIDSNIESGLGKIHHQQRVSAAAELLRRAYDNDPKYAQTSTAPTLAVGPVTPEVRPETGPTATPASPTVIPAKAGTLEEARRSAIHTPASQDAEPVSPDSDEEPLDLVAMAKEIVANLDPSDFEEEPESNHKPDYSMWDIIERQPQPAMTEEHARIGAAQFREVIQKQRLWEKSEMKTPTRKDYDNYDDG